MNIYVCTIPKIHANKILKFVFFMAHFAAERTHPGGHRLLQNQFQETDIAHLKRIRKIEAGDQSKKNENLIQFVDQGNLTHQEHDDQKGNFVLCSKV